VPLLRALSASEQTAAHLRAELERGRWSGLMPGVKQLAGEVGVNHKTIEAALRQLEHEGLLVGQGQGRKRQIVLPGGKAARPLRIAMLNYDPVASADGYIVELQHLLVEAGHTAFFTDKSLTELGMDVARVSRLVKRTDADAWVVVAGSRPVLEWISAQPVPAFALFGRKEGLPIAATGPDKPPALAAATRHLTGLGHRRIVLLARGRRWREPGRSERAFLDELKACGIAVSEYNLPEWEETREGFQGILRSLFRVTAPTALIVDEASFFVATQQFLATRGIRVPHQISLVCTDDDPAFAWCMPTISHLRWDSAPVIRRVVRWAATVSQGRTDLKQTLFPSEFVIGGTTGPAPAG
jgi:hypothetical protein